MIKKYITLIAVALIGSLSLNAQITWNTLRSGLENFQIVNDHTGVYYRNEDGYSHGMNYDVFKSDNYFQLFEHIRGEQGTYGCCSIDNIFFAHADTGYISIMDQAMCDIERTYDGGETWEFHCNAGLYGHLMHFYNSSLFWTADYYEYGQESSLKRNNSYIYTTSEYMFNRDDSYEAFIYFVTMDIGYIACKKIIDNHGVLLRTADGGYTWEEAIPSGILVKDIEFFTPEIGIVVGTQGRIYRTTDSGLTWSEIDSGTIKSLNSISSYDNYGYIGGSFGIIFKTTDYGETWEAISSNSTSSILQIELYENDQLLAYNAAGKLLSNYTSIGNYEFLKKNITIHPNPATSSIKIDLGFRDINPQYTITTIDGRTLLSGTGNNIDITSLKPAVYLINIEVEDNVVVKKFVKQ